MAWNFLASDKERDWTKQFTDRSVGVREVLERMGRRGKYGNSWTKFFKRLQDQDTPESDIFFWAEELADGGDADAARELVRQYLLFRRTHGRIGEFGLVGESEGIAKGLGEVYPWNEG